MFSTWFKNIGGRRADIILYQSRVKKLYMSKPLKELLEDAYNAGAADYKKSVEQED